MATSVNFFQPGTDAAIDANAIQRQREMAMLLLKQSQQAPQGQMVSGHYVPPSALEGVSNAVRGLGSVLMNKQSDDRERKMAEALRTRNTQDANDFIGALQGSPGRKIQPLTPNDDEGNPMPVVETAAVPPDRNRALALALQSQNPQLQAMGGDLIKRQMDASELQDALRAAGLALPGAAGASGQSSPEGAAAPMAGASGAASTGMPGGMNPQAFALMLSKNPQANKIGGVIQDLSKPQVLAEGGTLLERGPGGAFAPSYIAPKTEAGINIGRGPNGMMAAPIPGFAEAKGGIAGAEAQARQAAESANTLVPVDTATGPRMMTRAQALGMAGAPQAPQMAAPTNLSEAGMARNAALTDNPSADAAREIAALKSDLSKVPDSNSKRMIQAEIDRLTGQMQKYGGDAGRGAINPSPAVPGIALQSDEQKAYGKTRANDYAKTAAEIQSQGRAAGGMIRNLDVLTELYKDPNVAKGAAAENISSLKNLASSFDVNIKGVGAEQAAEAITNKMALDARSTAEGGGMPGAMSDSDRSFLKAMQPGLSKTPEGRAQIMSTMRRVAQRQSQVAELANAYERRNGQIDAGFDKVLSDFANQNPMFANQKPAAAPASGFKILGVR